MIFNTFQSIQGAREKLLRSGSPKHILDSPVVGIFTAMLRLQSLRHGQGALEPGFLSSDRSNEFDCITFSIPHQNPSIGVLSGMAFPEVFHIIGSICLFARVVSVCFVREYSSLLLLLSGPLGPGIAVTCGERVSFVTLDTRIFQAFE